MNKYVTTNLMGMCKYANNLLYTKIIHYVKDYICSFKKASVINLFVTLADNFKSIRIVCRGKLKINLIIDCHGSVVCHRLRKILKDEVEDIPDSFVN